jgi:hypothetical protein
LAVANEDRIRLIIAEQTGESRRKLERCLTNDSTCHKKSPVLLTKAYDVIEEARAESRSDPTPDGKEGLRDMKLMMEIYASAKRSS